MSVAGWLVAILGLFSLLTSLIAIFVVLWGSVLLCIGVWLLGPRIDFDKDQQSVIFKHFWTNVRVPLSDVVALQVIPGTFVDSDHATFGGHQLNLICGQGSESVSYTHLDVYKRQS